MTLLASAAGASAAPLNDHFADAIALTGSGPTASGDSTGASREAGEPPHLGWFAGGASVWWTWTATRTRSLVIDTCGSAFDAGLALYTPARASMP